MVLPSGEGKTVDLGVLGEVLGTNLPPLPCGQLHGRAGHVNPVPRVVGAAERRLCAVRGRVGAAPACADRRLGAWRQDDAQAGARADFGTVEGVGSIADRQSRAAAVRENLVVLPGIRQRAPINRLAAPRHRIRGNRDLQLARSRWLRRGAWCRHRSRRWRGCRCRGWRWRRGWRRDGCWRRSGWRGFDASTGCGTQRGERSNSDGIST
jgi:hypothetical protein